MENLIDGGNGGRENRVQSCEDRNVSRNDLDRGIANKERNVLYVNRVAFNVLKLLKMPLISFITSVTISVLLVNFLHPIAFRFLLLDLLDMIFNYQNLFLYYLIYMVSISF